MKEEEESGYTQGHEIGSGAFGSVFELLHNGKSCSLAVKKIDIGKSRMTSIHREVRIINSEIRNNLIRFSL